MKKGVSETNGSMRSVLAKLEKQLALVQPRLSEKRRPFIIEFAGTPKSGKTTTISQFTSFSNEMA